MILLMYNERMNETKRKYTQVIEKKLKEKDYQRFDTFIAAYLGLVLEGTGEAREARKRAYAEFLHRVQHDKPASLPTIRRWFGIHEQKDPSREQLIRLAFSLKLDVGTTESFLTKGIGEPSFQVNDYTELIAMYCLENKVAYDKYENLVVEYEKNLQTQQEICHESNTQWIFRQFEHIKYFSEADFMYWMWEHASIFKGYSKTAQDYLNKYRKLVLEYMQQDVKKRLELLLSETGYTAWRKKRKIIGTTKEGDLIKRYLRRSVKSRQSEISDDLRNNILELTKLAYSEAGLNTKLLAELFSASEESVASAVELPKNSIRTISAKYLSDLFNIPVRNEMMIHAKQAVCELQTMEPEQPCPSHIKKQMIEFGKTASVPEKSGEAQEWLETFIYEGKRRRLIVKRNDLLPLILYVAQQVYLAEVSTIGELDKVYDKETALKTFRDLADSTMIACNMAPLDEKRVFDMILLQCFQEDEMYGYDDVMGLI